MLLLFNPEVTRMEKETIHGAITPPSMVHVAFEIEDTEYDNAKQLLSKKNIQVEKMVTWSNELKSRSIYFRDPAGNLIELITKNHWPTLE